MEHLNTVVAIYENHTATELAIKELFISNFQMRQVSIVGSDVQNEEHVVGYYNLGARMRYWGTLGAFWGGLWGYIVGSGFFYVPGIGALVVGGNLVSRIVDALEGSPAHGELSALGAGLHSLGIPQEDIVDYEGALRTNRFLLIAQATPQQAEEARDILKQTDSNTVRLHQAPGYAESVL